MWGQRNIHFAEDEDDDVYMEIYGHCKVESSSFN